MVSPAELSTDPAFDPASIAATTARLVRCRSVNPGGDEILMVRQLLFELEGLGCETQVVEFAEGRPSIAAVLEGRRRSPRIVLNGHMDTVAADDPVTWRHDPFAGTEVDGVVWGRGAVDMKGGLAAQLACARALAPRRGILGGTVILQFAAGEECGEPGTLSLLRRGFGGDWGIVTEPTNLRLATAAKGVAWLEVKVAGNPAHAGVGSERDPLKVLGGVLSALDRHSHEIARRRHPLLGSPRCTVTMLRAGTQHNATAEQVTLMIDRRLIPGETPESALEEIRTVIDAVVARDFETHVELRHHAFEPAEVSDGELVANVEKAATTVTGKPVERIGTPFGSDVRNLIHDAGMEAVTFGPGDMGLMHCVDERVEVAQVRDAALVLAMTASELLGEG